MSHKMLEFCGIFKLETTKAYLIDMDEGEIWFPKSQISFQYEPYENEEFCFEIPEWLAYEKELI